MHTLIAENGNGSLELHSIQERLEEIRTYLENEGALKQSIIRQKEDELTLLKTLMEEKNQEIGKMQTQLAECRQNTEGTRQLINKLLNDISHYQNDIEWYKRTYVRRSLAGTIWEKIFRKRP